MDMKEKHTKHKARHGWRLWMFPGQAKEQSENDLNNILDKMYDKLKGKQDE